MSLFQTSVVKKYLNDLSPELTDRKYKEFQDYFGNPERQENIRNLKEEEYQEGFIRELFVKILGYTLNPEPNYNIVLEKKNVDDSKKADGAILRDSSVIAVIELKSTQTTDLDTVETQAFGYKHHNPKCQYIITSNFEKIRIYIQNAVDHLEFDLFNLSKEDFSILWLCFYKENVLSDLPLKIKEASVLQEENVTKKLYSDYSKFREEIFASIVKNNTEFDKLVLFKKTQKLLDRFLFTLFAEDRNLLPPNSISRIIDRWNLLKQEDAYKPLYDIFKQYFGYMNKGRKGQLPSDDIFSYNGGLFLPDEILDNIKIDDDLLYKHTKQLSSYNFETEVNVNILGHIFEHSLGEIENVQAEIAGEEIDKQKTRRKKDGIFYTPKYITKYIVENTVGKLCEEKRTELGIIDEEYAKGRKNRKKEIVKELDNKLTGYRNWLLEITILDPACGSGAFLNQALEFLIQEHKKIDELKAQLLGGSIVFSDIEARILEKNIFGVDLNEESVEIAKLSLWLRTAQKGRKLTTLSNHIKCGNSLIDDPAVAGEKAFNWQKEFPEVFAKGGFDVVIGNPPYVNLYNMSKIERDYFDSSDKYKSTYLKYDLYVLFLEKGISIVKENGYLSYIIPSVILSIPYGTIIRKILVENYTISRIVDFTGFMVFEDAMVETCIVNFLKTKAKKNNKVLIQKPLKSILDFQNNTTFISQNVFLDTENNQFRLDLDNNSLKIVEKFKQFNLTIGEIYYVSKGIVAFSKIDNRKKEDFLFDSKIDEKCQPYLEGKDVNRYQIEFNNKFLQYDQEIMSRPTFPELHQNSKILIRAISDGLNATFDDSSYYIDQKLIICSNHYEIEDYIAPSKKTKTPIYEKAREIDYLSTVGILNSKLSSFYYKKMLKGGVSILPEDIRQFPIPPVSENRRKIGLSAESIIKLRKDLINKRNKFLNRLKDNFELEEVNKNISNFYNLEFKSFLVELKKSKIQLSLIQQDEWEEYFNNYKNELNQIQNQLDLFEKEIDELVYELYGLTQEEIKIVEENN